MGFSEVSTLLWREREALQILLFKLVEEQLIVRSGQTRWLPHANREVEAALEELRGAEVMRAAEVGAIADNLAVTEPPTLAELAAWAPEPWATIFGEHRTALLQLIAEVASASDDNRALLVAGAQSVRETLLSMTQAVDTYDSRGAAASKLNQ